MKDKVSGVKELSGYKVTYCLFFVSGYNDELVEGYGGSVLLFNEGDIIDSC